MLRIVHKDKFSAFGNLFEKGEVVKIHARNLQVVVTKMFKVTNGIVPKIISKMLKLSYPINILRNKPGWV